MTGVSIRQWRAGLKIWPFTFLLAVHVLLFGVPALAGYSVWSGDPRSPPAISLPQTIDTTTFATLNRPIRAWIRRTLSQGQLPLWLDTQALGLPLIEQYEYHLLYPLEWLKWLGEDTWWTVVLCLELAGAGAGLYLAARSMLGVSAPAALAGALVFTGIGYPTWFYLSVGFFTPLLQLPFTLLLLYRLAHGRMSVPLIAGLAVLVALILLTGQPQIMLCIGLVLGAFFLLELLLVRRAGIDLLQRLAAGGLAGVLALLIAAPQIVPFVQDQVWGGAYSNHPFDVTGRLSATSVMNLLNPVSPFLQGPIVPWIDDARIVPVSTDDFGLSFGAAGAFLIVVGAWAGLRTGGVARRLALLLGCCLLALAWMTLVDPRIWPFAMVNVSRYSPPVLGLLGSMLAACGAERLAIVRTRVAWISLAVVLLIPIAGVLYLLVELQPDRIRDTWLMMHAAVLTVAPLAALIAFVAVRVWRRHRPASVAMAALLLVTGECLFAMRYGLALENEWVRLAPLGLFALAAMLTLLGTIRLACGAGVAAACLVVAHWAYLSPRLAGVPQMPWSSPSVQTIASWRDASDGPARVLANSGWLHPNVNAPLGIQSLANRNPVTTSALVGYLYEFWRPSVIQMNQRTIGMIQMEGASVHHRRGPDGNVILPDNVLDWSEYFAARPFFNLVGLNLLADDSSGALRRMVDEDDVKDLRGVHRDDCTPESRSAYGGYCIEVYEDRRALPRAYVAQTFAIIPKTRDGWAARRWLSENQRIMMRVPVAELDEHDLASIDGVSYQSSSPRLDQPGAIRPAKIVSYTPNEVIIRLDRSRSGLLVLNDAYHPGWQAFVNGSPRRVLRVNSVVRGIQVYSEETEIRFVFENGFSRNVTISLSTLLLLTLGAFLLPRLRARSVAARWFSRWAR